MNFQQQLRQSVMMRQMLESTQQKLDEQDRLLRRVEKQHRQYVFPRETSSDVTLYASSDDFSDATNLRLENEMLRDEIIRLNAVLEEKQQNITHLIDSLRDVIRRDYTTENHVAPGKQIYVKLDNKFW